jgi:hypothetical protein
MILLQEGMAAGPYVLLFLFIILAAIGLIIYVIYLLVDNNKSTKKLNEVDSKDKHETIVDEIIDKKIEELSPGGVNVLLIIFLVIVFGGLLSLLKWGCNIKFD